MRESPASYLDVVEDGCGDVGVQVDQSFLLQQLRQRAVAHKHTRHEAKNPPPP